MLRHYSASCNRLGKSLSPVIPSEARNLSSSSAQRRILFHRTQNFFVGARYIVPLRCNLSCDYAKCRKSNRENTHCARNQRSARDRRVVHERKGTLRQAAECKEP